MPKYDESALFRSGLPVIVGRLGGVEYTQSEFAAILARRGECVVTAEVDKSGPGEPVTRMKTEPSANKTKMPVV